MLGGRLFAWAMARGQGWSDRVYAQRKRALFAGLTGDVLEIGAGTGANLEFLPRGVRWTGVEPNPWMHPYALRRAERFGVDARMSGGQGEGIQADAASFDAVVVTLVLCSVRDPASVVAEARRVLRPGGKLVFIEHVAAPTGSAVRWRQDRIDPLWSRIAGGCHPNRETESVLAAAGFASLEVEHFEVPFPGGIVSPQIAGMAVCGGDLARNDAHALVGPAGAGPLASPPATPATSPPRPPRAPAPPTRRCARVPRPGDSGVHPSAGEHRAANSGA